ncbi:MAG: MBL fold metallo-hydrolase [Pseudomonadota bacterium]
MSWTRIGDVEIARVLESNGPFMSVYKFFPDATEEGIASHRDWLYPNVLTADTNELIMPIQSFVLRTEHHTVLVDACVGNHKSVEWFKPWHQKTDAAFKTGLSEIGVSVADIDFVFCTHLHVDHSGWNTELKDGRWVPTFPNAKYVLSKDEVNYMEMMHTEHGDPTYAENIAPLIEAKQVELVDNDYNVDDQVWIEPTPGHTPGHMAIRIDSNSKRGVITGDLIHSPLQCHHPEWNFKFDSNKKQAAQTRRAFLERYCDCDAQVLTSHFPLPSTGRLESTNSAFVFVPDEV